jgi:hypothetical protein
VEDHLVQNISQFLIDLLSIAGFQGLDQLVGFFKKVLNQAAMSLLGIPGATAGSAELVGNGD